MWDFVIPHAVSDNFEMIHWTIMSLIVGLLFLLCLNLGQGSRIRRIISSLYVVQI